MNPQTLDDLLGLFPNPRQFVYGQRCQEVALLARHHFDETIRFGEVRRNLGYYLAAGDTD